MEIIANEEARWAKCEAEANHDKNESYKQMETTLNEFQINLVRYLGMSLLEEHGAELKDDAARMKYIRDKARAMVATQDKSKLYAPYYLPEEAENFDANSDWIGLYRKYGFYWPTEEDLVQLAVDHPNFKMSDLVLEQVRWKSSSCGFAFIQLVFSNGITSPVFETFDEDKKAEDYITTNVANGANIKFIRVRTCEEKYVEKLQFVAEGDKLLAEIAPCRCGNDELLELKPDYRVVGLFGIRATDKYCWQEDIRQLDQIRCLGFISMKLQY